MPIHPSGENSGENVLEPLHLQWYSAEVGRATIETASLTAAACARSPFGVSLTDARPHAFGRYIFVNPAYCTLTGYAHEELTAMTFHAVMSEEMLPGLLTELDELIAGTRPAADREIQVRRPDGTTRWVRQHRSLVRDEAGEPLFFLTHSEDISERKREEAAALAAQRRAEEALRESEARYRLLAENAADMIVCTRADRTRSYVSPASKTLLGYEPGEILELDFATFLHPEDSERVAAEYARFLEEGGRETHTYRLRHRDGSYVWCEAHWVRTASRLNAREEDDGGNAVVSVVRNISERMAAEERIAHLARHDALTGLPNRLAFGERLQQALVRVARGGSAAVLVLDLDHFKSVNDTLGHAAGDALLRFVSDRLRSCVRECDTVARTGGDEFVVLMTGGTPPKDAAVVAGRIVDAITEPFFLDGQQVIVGASVGGAVAPRDGLTAEVLVRNADVALYQSKREGRGTFRFFEPEMDAHVRARHELELDLRQALRDRVFTLAYQPIVHLGTGEIAGVEALLRWPHPVRGMVSPAEFIPVAEDCGLIVPLGERVLRDACLEASGWPDHIKLAVNLSPVQFCNRRLVQTVSAALFESGLAPARLELEITESVLLQDKEGTLSALHELRALGVGISLDDFGTGYSSLGYLHSFPFDKIKIDQSFVRDLLFRVESAAIVRAVIELARTLGITTVAEGVETAEQLERVRDEGCSQAQGYLFSRPLPAAELRRVLPGDDRPDLAAVV